MEQNTAVTEEINQFMSYLSHDVHETLEVLTAALDARHPYTGGHSYRVAELSTCIAREMGVGESQQHFIHIAAHLHDIGKIGMPDSVLLKKGRLTVEEYEVIKKHPETGFQILRKVKILQYVAHVVRHHHERWDGAGYPGGLAGDRIPLASRIIAVADAYDAMTSMRPYRPSLTHEQSIAELGRCRGSQFDPAVVDAFIRWKPLITICAEM
ncbi:MAG TPA: HD-GYP domain-containing protein [Negativicutes bacterium]|nr:HD-GYP domain-containing protein [Negativicutes bacterium]